MMSPFLSHFKKDETKINMYKLSNKHLKTEQENPKLSIEDEMQNEVEKIELKGSSRRFIKLSR